MMSVSLNNHQSKSQKIMFKAVVDYIYTAKTMEYWWSKKTDDVKHTGIVIKFDHTPKISLDFGGILNAFVPNIKVGAQLAKGCIDPKKNAKNAILNLILDGKVTISHFSAAKVNITGRLVKLTLSNIIEKENAINQFTAINFVNIGVYHIMENNCRTYVIAVALLLRELPEFADEDWNNFQEEMQTLLSEDHWKFKRLLEIAEKSMSLKMILRVLNHDLQAVIGLPENQNY